MSDGVLARCLGVEEAAKRLEEVHEFVCGTTTPVNLYRRLQRQGTYWPDMARDVKAREEACLKCTWMPDRAECAFLDVVDWGQPYIEYLTKGTLPDDRYEANKLKKMANRYIVNDGKLFKRGSSGILLRCLSGDEAMEVMHQSHAGTLAEHQGGLLGCTIRCAELLNGKPLPHSTSIRPASRIKGIHSGVVCREGRRASRSQSTQV